jgi:hypothetical protein
MRRGKGCPSGVITQKMFVFLGNREPDSIELGQFGQGLNSATRQNDGTFGIVLVDFAGMSFQVGNSPLGHGACIDEDDVCTFWIIALAHAVIDPCLADGLGFILVDLATLGEDEKSLVWHRHDHDLRSRPQVLKGEWAVQEASSLSRLSSMPRMAILWRSARSRVSWGLNKRLFKASTARQVAWAVIML